MADKKKARLVAQGYTQEERIDYDEIGLKSAFHIGKIEEGVYMFSQPPGFEDPQFPDKVYKVEKALYGLHQAPRAWYETLSTYLLENGFRRGIIDKTLFIKKDKGDILLVQVYVDDIIFGSTKKSLCTEFEGLMHKKFQMSSMGELTFFLGLQVMQRDDGIFISQDKYVADILKKFDFSSVKTASTPIETNKALLKDEEAEDVDVHLYRSMIGSLMYLTASRPSHHILERSTKHGAIIQGIHHLTLEAFSYSGLCWTVFDRKSTQEFQFLGKKTDFMAMRVAPLFCIYDGTNRVVEGEGSGQPFEPQPPSLTAPPSHEEQVTIVASQSQKTHIPRRAKRGRDIEIPQSSVPLRSSWTTSAMIPQWGNEDLRTVLALEQSKTAQDLVIKKLKKKVKRLEKKQWARTPDMKLFKIDTSRRKSLDKENKRMEKFEGDTVNASGYDVTRRRKGELKRMQRERTSQEEASNAAGSNRFPKKSIRKEKRISLALKAKKKSSDEECSTSRSEAEEYAPWRDKLGLGFNSFEASTSETKEIKFMKSHNETSPDGGPLNKGGAYMAEAAPKAIIGPPICLGVNLEPDEWIKDSGCSKHMMGNRKLFSTYKAYNRGNVIFGSNLRGNIIGKGQICDNKCRVTLSEHDSEITKDGKIIGRASKELVRNLPKLKFDKHLCDACKIGKQAHASHKAKSMVSTTRCLELLHMDLFGPFAVRSYEGNLYTLVIVDDYSRYTWTRFLKNKIEAFDQFEIFSKKIQNQLGCTIVSIRTDHGREFDNEVQFGEFCNANGITHNFSAPRTPQSNGVVERKNRTLQEISRTMLNEQSLPQKFWCNAVDTSTYILNRILIRAILGNLHQITLECYSQNSKAYIILNKHTRKVEESLNVTFDETPPPSKTSPLVDDDLDEEEAIKVTEKKNLESDIVDETLEIDEIVNIKESRNHPLENVIGNLNQRTLRSQAQNQSNFFCFISTIEPKNVNEALTDDSWIVAMQEELNQFIANDVWELVPQPRNMTIIGTKWVFRNKLDENVARLESIRILLAYACALDFKLFQMDVKSAFLNGFINEEVYVAQPPGFIDFEKPDHVYKLKKALYGLKQAPKAWPDIMFSVCLCARFQEAPKTSHLEAVKRIFRYIKGTTHLGLWYPKGTDIETVVYADSDHAGDYVDRKSTSGICTFVGCCLTSWFSKKQTALAISTTEAEYVSAGKACQQALWMKQALIDYDVRLDDVPIMCDNKGAIDLSKNPVQHSQTKHIKIRHHFLRDNVQKGHISIKKVSSVDNIADILTKPLKRESFNYLRLGLGMMEHIP
ncbi:retrovirus-related pol polyprotein from transposon TNT 1-94 [Tanacetum coccineum]